MKKLIVLGILLIIGINCYAENDNFDVEIGTTIYFNNPSEYWIAADTAPCYYINFPSSTIHESDVQYYIDDSSVTSYADKMKVINNLISDSDNYNWSKYVAYMLKEILELKNRLLLK